MNKLAVHFRLSPEYLKNTLIGIVLLNFVMLAGTWLLNIYYFDILQQDWSAGSQVKWVLLQFNLATENVFAVWYSSKLLLLAGVASVLCFIIDIHRFRRGIERSLTYGWLLMASVFALLSLDEMGSIHEKIGNIARLNPFGDYVLGWVVLLSIPIVLVGMLMMGFAYVHLKRAPAALAFTVLSVLLFLSIPLQEYFETQAWHSAADPDVWRRPVFFLLLEEGTELFGSFSFLLATAIYALHSIKPDAGRPTKQKIDIEFSFTPKSALLFVSFMIGLFSVSLLLIKIMEAYFKNGKGGEGIASNWYPSVIAFLLALFCFYLSTYVQHTGRYIKSHYRLLAIFCLFTSAYFGSNLYAYTLYEEEILPHFVHGIFLLVAVLIGIRTVVLMKNIWSRLGAIVWIVMLVVAFSIGKDYVAEITFLSFGVLLLSLIAHLYEWQYASFPFQQNKQQITGAKKHSPAATFPAT